MASLIRQHYTRPIPPDAEIITRKGKCLARFKDKGGRTVLAPLTGNGERCRVPSEKWYGQYVDGNGVLQCVPLSTNKTAAQQMLNELVKRAELEKAGVADPFREHRKRPLA